MGTENLHVYTELHTQDLELLKGESLFTHGMTGRYWELDTTIYCANTVY